MAFFREPTDNEILQESSAKVFSFANGAGFPRKLCGDHERV